MTLPIKKSGEGTRIRPELTGRPSAFIMFEMVYKRRVEEHSVRPALTVDELSTLLVGDDGELDGVVWLARVLACQGRTP